ncbi:MAG: hypothetical protein R3Y11_03335 [Pseudomonadota bacterium]
MSTISNTNITDKVFSQAGSSVTSADEKIATYMTTAESGTLTEMQMVELNMLVSQRTTLMSLFSGAVKNLTDTEKQVANKM